MFYKFFIFLLLSATVFSLGGCGASLAVGPFPKFRTTHVNVSPYTQHITDASSGKTIVVPPGGHADLPYIWSARDSMDTPIIVRKFDANGNMVGMSGGTLRQHANQHDMTVGGDPHDAREFRQGIQRGRRIW
jgi:hypothetical protein